MSRCFGCYYYYPGYMWNRCDFFEMEYFREPEECKAFSLKEIPDGEAKRIWEELIKGCDT